MGQGAVCRAAGRPCRQLVRRRERRLSWRIQCTEYWSPAPAVASPARDVARCNRCCVPANKATGNLVLARTNIADCSDLPLASNGSFGSALVDDQGNGADGSYRRLAASCPAKPRSRKASKRGRSGYNEGILLRRAKLSILRTHARILETMTLGPIQFRDKVLRNIAAQGEVGASWLEALPSLLRRLEVEWGIKVGVPSRTQRKLL